MKLVDILGRGEEHLEGKINTLETNSKNENIGYAYWSRYVFKMSHQPTTNLVKDDKGNLVADSHSILIGGIIISLSF
jgi:hypothetical protein